MFQGVKCSIVCLKQSVLGIKVFISRTLSINHGTYIFLSRLSRLRMFRFIVSAKSVLKSGPVQSKPWSRRFIQSNSTIFDKNDHGKFEFESDPCKDLGLLLDL